MSHASKSRSHAPQFTTRIATALAPLVGFVLTLALVIRRTSLGGPLYDFALLPNRIPLEVAGADPLLAVASVGIGQSWLYFTGTSTALLAVGLFAAIVGSRGGTILGAVLASGAAGTLVRVEGCHCASGSTMSLWELLI